MFTNAFDNEFSINTAFNISIYNCISFIIAVTIALANDVKISIPFVVAVIFTIFISDCFAVSICKLDTLTICHNWSNINLHANSNTIANANSLALEISKYDIIKYIKPE